MLQRNFKEFFLENILDFLWRQWSTLGVLGQARTEDKWVIDPEALLVFSLKITRYEPRLFDEILDWLCINGIWLDIQRLRGILREKEDEIHRLIGVVSNFLTAQGQERKWRNLAKLSLLKGIITTKESLFIEKSGKPYPMANSPDPLFLDYDFNRSSYERSKKSREINFKTFSAIRFLLRSLFGIGSRSECILYLLTHEAGHPSEIAKAVGISVRGVQDSLIELAKSNLILTRIKGKRKIEYWLSQKKWWEFLSGANFEEVKMPVWLDWISLYSALMNVWNVLNEVEKTKSDYMRSSRLREAMETISLEFSESGIDLPPIPDRNVRPESYEEEFQNFIKGVLGAKSGTSR